MNIEKILLIVIIIYLIFSHSKKNKNIENFAFSDTDKNEIRGIIKEIYNTDMDAIRTLADFAKKIQDGNNLTIPGNLTVTGTITGNNNLNISTINSSGTINCAGSINNSGNIQSKGEIKTLDVNNNEKASLNNILTSVNSINSSITTINTNLDKKINNNDLINLEKIDLYTPGAGPSGFNLSVHPLTSAPIITNSRTVPYSILNLPVSYDWKIKKN